MTRMTAAGRRSFKALIVGGGVAGLEAMLALRALAPDLVDVEAVSAERHFYYRPLAVAATFGLGKVRRWEASDLARTAGADFSLDVLAAVDTDRGEARLTSGAVIEYDALLIASGARTQQAVEGASWRSAGRREHRAVSRAPRRAGRRAAGRHGFSSRFHPGPVLAAADLRACAAERPGVRATGRRRPGGPRPQEATPLALSSGRAPVRPSGRSSTTRGIEVWCSKYPAEFTEGRLSSVPDGSIQADFVVAGPRLAGPAIERLPSTPEPVHSGGPAWSHPRGRSSLCRWRRHDVPDQAGRNRGRAG